MSTPPESWLTPRAAASAPQHPAAVRQHTWTPQLSTEGRGARAAHSARSKEAHAQQRAQPSYTASRSAGPALYDPPAAPSIRPPLPRYGTEPASVHAQARELYSGTDAQYRGGPVGVDELAFGAPGLAEAMVHQEASARESAEQKLDEERERCELLQLEIQRLQAQLAGAPLDWKCPICTTYFPRAEKSEHGKRCLTQFVEFVQSGSGPGQQRAGEEEELHAR